MHDCATSGGASPPPRRTIAPGVTGRGSGPPVPSPPSDRKALRSRSKMTARKSTAADSVAQRLRRYWRAKAPASGTPADSVTRRGEPPRITRMGTDKGGTGKRRTTGHLLPGTMPFLIRAIRKSVVAFGILPGRNGRGEPPRIARMGTDKGGSGKRRTTGRLLPGTMPFLIRAMREIRGCLWHPAWPQSEEASHHGSHGWARIKVGAEKGGQQAACCQGQCLS